MLVEIKYSKETTFVPDLKKGTYKLLRFAIEDGKLNPYELYKDTLGQLLLQEWREETDHDILEEIIPLMTQVYLSLNHKE